VDDVTHKILSYWEWIAGLGGLTMLTSMIAGAWKFYTHTTESIDERVDARVGDFRDLLEEYRESKSSMHEDIARLENRVRDAEEAEDRCVQRLEELQRDSREQREEERRERAELERKVDRLHSEKIVLEGKIDRLRQEFDVSTGEIDLG